MPVRLEPAYLPVVVDVVLPEPVVLPVLAPVPAVPARVPDVPPWPLSLIAPPVPAPTPIPLVVLRDEPVLLLVVDPSIGVAGLPRAPAGSPPDVLLLVVDDVEVSCEVCACDFLLLDFLVFVAELWPMLVLSAVVPDWFGLLAVAADPFPVMPSVPFID